MLGAEAERYLEERRRKMREIAESSARTMGAEVVEVIADGGAINTGVFSRPKPGEGVPLTPIRQLPRATKNVTRREVRFIAAKEPNGESQRRVDLNIAALKHPEVTGERMLYTAMEAGRRDNIFVHGVFDMGSWPCQQFLEQF